MKKFFSFFFLNIAILSFCLNTSSKEKQHDYSQGELIEFNYYTEDNWSWDSDLGMTVSEQDVYDFAVKIGDMVYVGRYKPSIFGVWSPKFTAGQKVNVRFKDNKMYVQRSNGKEIKTKIVKSQKN